MNWHDGRDSCTCRCTPTGLPAQIPTELRRGSANKTQTVILEVLAMPRSTHSFLRKLFPNLPPQSLSSVQQNHPPDYLPSFDTTFFDPPALQYIIYCYNYIDILIFFYYSLYYYINIFLYIYLYITYTYYTLYIMLHVSPRFGVLGRYVYLLYCYHSHIIYFIYISVSH